jgi:hypothetical protein
MSDAGFGGGSCGFVNGRDVACFSAGPPPL